MMSPVIKEKFKYRQQEDRCNFLDPIILARAHFARLSFDMPSSARVE
jgi:hypothetical protein